jgi:carbamoylphosphate synthase small subunit
MKILYLLNYQIMSTETTGTIPSSHEKLSYPQMRTPEQKKYREDIYILFRGKKKLPLLAEEIARKFLEDEQKESKYILAKYGMSEKSIEELIKAGYSEVVIDNLKNFKEIDHNKVARLVIENGGGKYVAEHLEKFNNVDHNEIARLLIEKGDG